MKGEILIVVWCLIVALLQQSRQFNASSNVEEIGELSHNRRVMATISFLPIIVWAGFRQGYGYSDTNAYIYLYDHIETDFTELVNYVRTIGKDPTFYFFVGFIKKVFGDSYRPLFLIVAIIQGISMIRFYGRYSPSIALSFFLFVISADYMGWMMNGTRQFLAVSIIYLATPWLFQKKYFRFLLVVLIASTIHGSAIILLPITFIVQGKPWNAKTIGFIVFAILALVFTQQFTGIMSDALDGTQYESNISAMETQAGTNPLRVAVYSIPAIISFIGRRKIAELDDLVLNVSVNMSIITAGLYAISMVTSGIMMGRLPIYTSLFNYVTLPYELHLFFGKDRKIVVVIMVVLYLLYYYYLMHFAYGRI